MKRISIIIAFFAVCSLTACLKDKPNTDFSGTQGTYIAEITTSNVNSTPNAPSSGAANFSGAVMSIAGTDPDTIWFTVNIASDYPPKKDIPVTIAVDGKNLFSPNAVVYTLLPDSTYKIPTTTGTIKAGSRLDTFYVIIDPNKVDPTESYELPITITSATGATISGNLATIYLHAIGNPLAGYYNSTGTRWNYTGVIGYGGGPIPSGGTATNLGPLSPKFGSPLDPTTLGMDYANLGPGDYYVITYDPSDPDAISVTVNDSFLASISNFKVITQTYDHTTKTMHIVSTYNNGAGGSGSDRIVDETFVHQ
ncbi:DUF1735 domain-containing protein [Puia sp.]|jgi:hypothetical protein|uniref:DUF1735 domain-containing protein n=1 Tax=Puia sp. TaxID=2045100 RepID=UPI002F3E3255